MTQAQWEMNSSFGSLYLVASDKGLKGVFWERQPTPMAKSLASSNPTLRILSQAARELEEYFNGRRERFGVPLEIDGTPFQKRVWNQLLQIPYGTTYSYRELATLIQNEKAIRAVGTANGKNALCIVVPCHRVIASDGSLGGYSGGLERKASLLQLERRASLQGLSGS